MRWSDCQASDVRWAVCPNAKRFRGFRPPSGSALGGPGSAHRAGWFRGEFDMPLPGAAKTIQPGFAQGAADWRSGPRRSILSVLYPVHPFPLRGTSPQGETRDMREKTASHILQVPFRHSPFGGWRHHLARWEACHWIRGSRGSPMNPVPLPPPQFGWSIKRKALLWAGLGLTLTNLHILCRMCTVAL